MKTLLASLLMLLLSVFLADAQQKPNVVLIYVDDLGYGELGAYGCDDIPTPHIDRLANEGVRFTEFYITNPPCCPSRCSLMVGQYGQRFGKYGMSRGLPIPEDRPTLAKYLSDHGYQTGQIGKWDIGTKRQGPLQVGFDEVRKDPPRKKYTADELAEMSPAMQRQVKNLGGKSKFYCINSGGQSQWLTDYDGDSMVDFVGRHKDKPFFLYWSPEAVHSPSFETPARLTDRTTARPGRKKLAGAIVSVDDQVGKLLSALEQHKLRQNTLVIFSSDNGANPSEGGSSAPYTGGKGKGTQKEGWVRVPTIFSMPGSLPQGTDYDGLVANFDLYSTITSLTTSTIPPHCDGVDLLPYLRQEKQGDAHEYLFWLNNDPTDAVRRHLIAVRHDDWRLYRKYDQDPWQLFDLRKDPKEENNLAQMYPHVVSQLAEQHAQWSSTLAPLEKIPKVPGRNPQVPFGHGWAKAKN